MGPKITKNIVGKVRLEAYCYEFVLTPAADGRLYFANEKAVFREAHTVSPEPSITYGSGHSESRLKNHTNTPAEMDRHGLSRHLYDGISNWVVYHFHDTSATAGVRRSGPINDNEFLRPDAENLAAFLYRLSQTDTTSYSKIRDVVRLAAPFFDDFKLRPDPLNKEQIRLEWLQRDSDYPFTASQLSDGTLRFICLATALLQPRLPPTVLFDEPELGLHPYALTLLANLFKQAAGQSGTYVSKQLIVSTQSAPLLSEFEPEDVVVVERSHGESTFRRLEPAQLSEWLKEYSLGELWQKNVLGARPQADDAPQPSEPPGDSTVAPRQ
jgi:predicted ATPase